MRIAFVDPRCPFAAGPADLAARPLGGTESSMILLAETLAGLGHAVTVAQAGRAVRVAGAAEYVAMPLTGRWDAIILRDDPALAPALASQGPVWLWRHDFAKDDADALARLAPDVPIVGVSAHHAATLRRDVPGARVAFIHNPVQVFDPGPVAVDPTRLVFAASPHKHRWQALNLFADLAQQLPDLCLVLAHPGYKPEAEAWGPNVTLAGALARPALHRLLKGSLALFHATDFPETFGLLLAEANALGIPVIAPPVGAALEIVGDPRQVAQLGDAEALTARIRDWQQGGRPRPTADPRFSPERVARAWLMLLESA